MKLFNKKTKKILLTKVGSGIPTVEMYKIRRQLKAEGKTVALETVIMLLLATVISWGSSELELFGNNATVYLCILAGIAIVCCIYSVWRYMKISAFYCKRMQRMSVPIITFDQEDESNAEKEDNLFDLIDISHPAPASNVVKFHI